MIEDKNMEETAGDGEIMEEKRSKSQGDISEDWGDNEDLKFKIKNLKLKAEESDEDLATEMAKVDSDSAQEQIDEDEELAAAMAKHTEEPEGGDLEETGEEESEGDGQEESIVAEEIGEESDVDDEADGDMGDEEIADEEVRDETEIEGDGEAEENQASDGGEQGEADVREPQENVEVTVETVVEAVLFASDEPLTPLRLAGIVDSTVGNVKDSVNNLNAKYKAENRAFRIERVAGGYQMLTLSVYDVWLRKLVKDRGENKLSAAALETLAIIAYKQPIIRADIESIRGVAAGEMIRSLMSKGLVKIVGRAEILGRPMQYGTTKKFLETFGLNSLKDLPKNEELKKPEA